MGWADFERPEERIIDGRRPHWVPEGGFFDEAQGLVACLSSQVSPRERQEGQIGPRYRVKGVRVYQNDVVVEREMIVEPVGTEEEITKLIMFGGFSGDRIRFVKPEAFGEDEEDEQGDNELKPKRPRGDRERITRLTYRSLLNLVHKLRNCGVMFKSMLTLTYPEDFPKDGRLVKKQLDRFLKAYRRRYGKRHYAWFLEFQDRGAPHFHMLTDVEGWEVDREWLASTWARIVDGGSKSYNVHRHVKQWEVIRKQDGAARYVAKYAKKHRQKIVPADYENVGAFWGTSHSVKAEAIGTLQMDAEEILQTMGMDAAKFVKEWEQGRLDLRRYLWDQAQKFRDRLIGSENSSVGRLQMRTGVERAGGLRPSGGLSRIDRTPAELTRSQDNRPRRGQGAGSARPTRSRACLTNPHG
jgi:hypothetical protein